MNLNTYKRSLGCLIIGLCMQNLAFAIGPQVKPNKESDHFEVYQPGELPTHIAFQTNQTIVTDNYDISLVRIIDVNAMALYLVTARPKDATSRKHKVNLEFTFFQGLGGSRRVKLKGLTTDTYAYFDEKAERYYPADYVGTINPRIKGSLRIDDVKIEAIENGLIVNDNSEPLGQLNDI